MPMVSPSPLLSDPVTTDPTIVPPLGDSANCLPNTCCCDKVAVACPSTTSLTFSSKPRTNLFRRQGSRPICTTTNNSTLTPMRAKVPHVDALRILSDQICSSWYLSKGQLPQETAKRNKTHKRRTNIPKYKPKHKNKGQRKKEKNKKHKDNQH